MIRIVNACKHFVLAQVAFAYISSGRINRIHRAARLVAGSAKAKPYLRQPSVFQRL